MTLPTLGFRRETTPAPRAALVWRARDLSLNAATGQAGTLVRTASALTSWDSSGANALTVVRERPRWTDNLTTGGTAEVALQLGYVAGALTEYLSWPCNLIPGACSGLLTFMENETCTIGDAHATGASLFAISNDATLTGPYLSVYANNAGKYRIDHDNDVASVNAVMTTAPVTTNRVRLRWWLTSTGTVQIWQSINGAAETTPGASGTLALGSIWGTAGSPAKYWLNSLGTAGLIGYGYAHFTGCVVMPGNQTQATLLQALSY